MEAIDLRTLWHQACLAACEMDFDEWCAKTKREAEEFEFRVPIEPVKGGTFGL